MAHPSRDGAAKPRVSWSRKTAGLPNQLQSLLRMAQAILRELGYVTRTEEFAAMQVSKYSTRTAIAPGVSGELGRLGNRTHSVMVNCAGRASRSGGAHFTVITAAKKGWKN